MPCSREIDNTPIRLRPSLAFLCLVLAAILAFTAAGGNLNGWTSLVVPGFRPDRTLIYLHGTHNGGLEGFVAHVSGKFLDNYGKPKGKS